MEILWKETRITTYMSEPEDPIVDHVLAIIGRGLVARRMGCCGGAGEKRHVVTRFEWTAGDTWIAIWGRRMTKNGDVIGADHYVGSFDMTFHVFGSEVE